MEHNVYPNTVKSKKDLQINTLCHFVWKDQIQISQCLQICTATNI